MAKWRQGICTNGWIFERGTVQAFVSSSNTAPAALLAIPFPVCPGKLFRLQGAILRCEAFTRALFSVQAQGKESHQHPPLLSEVMWVRGSSSSTALYAQPDESWASYHDTKSPLPSISLRGISISLPGETEKATRTALNAALLPREERGQPFLHLHQGPQSSGPRQRMLCPSMDQPRAPQLSEQLLNDTEIKDLNFWGREDTRLKTTTPFCRYFTSKNRCWRNAVFFPVKEGTFGFRIKCK